jgi:predicted membrane-bound spermidine synthase
MALLTTQRESVHRPWEHAVSLVFFASGAAGLVFEIVWFYRCALIFGESAWSTSIVLSSFMCGLGVGNAVAARLRGTSRRLLYLYAGLEVLVAVSGVAVTYGLAHLTNVLPPLTRSFADSLALVNVVRLTTAFSVLLVPATAMGATLPLLVTVMCRRRLELGHALGRLYGWNTLGAVVGVVAAETALIPRVGVTGSAWTAALIDISAAAGAACIALRAEDGAARGRADSSARLAASSTVAWPLIGCAFLAGAALMALEVVWFRFLSMLVASNTLAISLMLAAVLAAIGLGGLAASRALNRGPNAAASLPAAACAAGLVTIASYVLFQFATGEGRALDWHRIVWFACALTFPTSLLSGVIFTLLGDALSHRVVTKAYAVSGLLVANTIGAAVGSWAAAFALLPAIGMERTLLTAALLYGLIGFIARRDASARPSADKAEWTFRTVALAMVLATVFFPFGLMSQKYFVRAAEEHLVDGSQLVASHEGFGETIFLFRNDLGGEPTYYRLVTNGISMSATTPKAKRYMRYFVYLPMLLHRTPLRRVMVICYGVGVTVGAATDIPATESIDVVEISRDIVAMSDLIYKPSEHPLRDPRVRLHAEDARYFLQTTDKRFDLITGEPPPPLTPGAVNIYTREYFRLLYDRLAEGGIATYWLPVARLAGTNHAAIIRAFCDVFEDCSLWNGTPADLMLLGTRSASALRSAADWAHAWSDPVLGSHLREIAFEQPEQIGATFIADSTFLRQLTAGVDALTDDYPGRIRVPVGTPLADARRRLDWDGSPLYRQLLDPDRARRAFEASGFVRRLWPDALLEDTLPFFDVQRTVNRSLTAAMNPWQLEKLHLLLTRTTLQQLPYWLLGLDNNILRRMETLPDDGSGLAEYVKGVRALVARDYRSAADSFLQSVRRGFGDAGPLLVYSLCMSGELDAANRLVRTLETSDADRRQFAAWLHATFGVGPA